MSTSSPPDSMTWLGPRLRGLAPGVPVPRSVSFKLFVPTCPVVSACSGLDPHLRLILSQRVVLLEVVVSHFRAAQPVLLLGHQEIDTRVALQQLNLDLLDQLHV